MTLYTIGFTKKTARSFFETLQHSRAKRLVDVRLNNASQLAGFAKRDDLEYFLKQLCHMDYVHLPDLLAPTPDLLQSYRKKDLAWAEYETRFLALIKDRRIQDRLSPGLLDNACLLCSEDKPDRCHRRLIVEYLNNHWGNLEIVHLG